MKRYSATELFLLLKEDGLFEHEIGDDMKMLLQPPEEKPNAITDEESDPSDSEDEANVDYLPTSVLSEQPAIIKEQSKQACEPVAEEKNEDFRWTKRPLTPSACKSFEMTPGEVSYPHCNSPADAFSHFLDENIVDHVLRQSNLYALQRDFDARLERRTFLCTIGFLILSGYRHLPQWELYWEPEEDVHLPFVSDNLRRTEVENFIKVLHLADNSAIPPDGPADEYYKVRPLFDLANQNFSKMPVPNTVSVDECLVSYFDSDSVKNFVRGRPIQCGFEMLCLASTEGFIHHAEPLCVKNTPFEDSGLDHDSRVALSVIEKTNIKQGTRVFFHKRFSTTSLLEELRKKKIGGTGPLLEGKTKGIPLTSPCEARKWKRGTSEVVSADDSVEVVRWRNNSVVTMASNCISGKTTKQVSRWSASDCKTIVIDCPRSVHEYNENMSGCDVHNQLQCTCEFALRLKKWWWPLFRWMLKVCLINGFLLYRSSSATSISFIDYTRSVATHLISSFGKPPSPSLTLSNSAVTCLRTDGVDHWPMCLTRSQAQNSQCQSCGLQTDVVCEKCNVPLHPTCFYGYHQ